MPFVHRLQRTSEENLLQWSPQREPETENSVQIEKKDVSCSVFNAMFNEYYDFVVKIACICSLILCIDLHDVPCVVCTFRW